MAARACAGERSAHGKLPSAMRAATDGGGGTEEGSRRASPSSSAFIDSHSGTSAAPLALRRSPGRSAAAAARSRDVTSITARMEGRGEKPVSAEETV